MATYSFVETPFEIPYLKELFGDVGKIVLDYTAFQVKYYHGDEERKLVIYDEYDEYWSICPQVLISGYTKLIRHQRGCWVCMPKDDTLNSFLTSW